MDARGAGQLQSLSYAGPLLSLAVVIACAHAGGALSAALRQPRVIGEIVAGLALGPAVLGALAPGVAAWLVPESARAFLDAVAQLGLVVFMLIVGLEVNLRTISRRRRLIAGVSAGSVAVPLTLGAGLGYAIRPDAAFAVFIGLALAITAMPVLARILAERGLAGSSLGAVALACAAVNDLAAWLGLAAVSALIGGGEPAFAAAGVLALAAVLLAARPLLARAPIAAKLPLLVAVALAAAAATEALGLHLVIGAFLAGLCAPRDERAQRTLAPVATAVLLPPFFFTAGLGVELSGLGAGGLGLLAATLALAFAGKFAGTVLPAVALGMGNRDALRLGALMNTRGLTELVLLSAGRELGLLGPRMYTVLVLCALVTTAATGPLLRAIDRLPNRARAVPNGSLRGSSG